MRDLRKQHLHNMIVSRLGLKPFDPKTDHLIVEAAKDGRFNQSNCALALYSNAFSHKAMFPWTSAPYGYLFERDGQAFSFGVYSRYDNELFGCVLPLSARLETIADFSKEALSALPISGVYVRFLRLGEYSTLVSESFGFKPAKEEPWLPDAPEEDESLSHSKVTLSKIVDGERSAVRFKPLKNAYKRAKNFLSRNGLEYGFVPLTPENLHEAREIVHSHFEMIEKSGKLVGSTHRDYYGLLREDIIELKSVMAYLGVLNSLPISVFICESNGPASAAGYAGITLRDFQRIAKVMNESSICSSDEFMRGISSLPTYAFVRLFFELQAKGYKYFFMGGSEHADIDTWKKKQIGAEKDPTYWAILSP
ncbi:MAG TPA: hypothetical protein VLD37_05800 [Candidatus Bilamarchaeum sp.]|nr:hypothetical protein [Candidatus Bilamarchaeum sp.]